jgi:hypothetical protein
MWDASSEDVQIEENLYPSVDRFQTYLASLDVAEFHRFVVRGPALDEEGPPGLPN